MSRNHKLTVGLFGLLCLGAISLSILFRNGRIGSPVSSPGRERGSAVPALNEPWIPSDEYLDRVRKMNAEFFGQVLDQFDKPVSNAEAEIVAQHFLDPDVAASESAFTLISDSEGKFHVESADTSTLRISVAPPSGYYFSNDPVGIYSYFPLPDDLPPSLRDKAVPPFHPDAKNPVIFRLKKKGDVEPLLHRENFRKLGSEQVIQVGLASNQLVKILYHFDPKVLRVNSIDHRPVYRWGIELNVPEGGIIERVDRNSTDSHSFVAPSDGYAHSVKFEYGADDETYGADVTKEFFVKFEDGTYARINTELIFVGNRHNAVFNSWFNPAGSPATEFDESKQISLPKK